MEEKTGLTKLLKNTFKKIFFPDLPVAKKGEVNYPFIDRFTLAHCMIGFAYGWFELGLVMVIFLAVFWEFVENPLKARLPFIFPHATADTLQNAVGDTLAVLLGWQVSRLI